MPIYMDLDTWRTTHHRHHQQHPCRVPATRYMVTRPSSVFRATQPTLDKPHRTRDTHVDPDMIRCSKTCWPVPATAGTEGQRGELILSNCMRSHLVRAYTGPCTPIPQPQRGLTSSRVGSCSVHATLRPQKPQEASVHLNLFTRRQL
jgi:hypothetical protein